MRERGRPFRCRRAAVVFSIWCPLSFDVARIVQAIAD